MQRMSMLCENKNGIRALDLSYEQMVNMILDIPEILGFFKEYRFLSNYHFADVELDGEIYRTTEHAYQAAKTLNPLERKKIQQLPEPKQARLMGQTVSYRSDWDDIKVQVMSDLNRQKFSQDPLRTMLLATGDAYLEETNGWKDTYWGVCEGKGLNMLGKVLMYIRQDLRTADKSSCLQ
jgi:ribA/ribD-fused uncharacterized protein